MQESSTVFDHHQPSKSKKRNSLDGDCKDIRTLGSRDSNWATESFKLPEIRFVRKATRTIRRPVKGWKSFLYLY